MKIAIWCDGTWCYVEDLDQYTWMSDDYAISEVPEDIDPSEFAAKNCAEYDAYLDDLCAHSNS